MKGGFRINLIGIAACAAIVLFVPILTTLGVPGRVVSIMGVFCLTGGLTLLDWLKRDKGLNGWEVLRSAITTNLLFVCICAAVMTVLVPA